MKIVVICWLHTGDPDINIYVSMYSLYITSLLCKTRFFGESSVAIAFSTIAVTHLYIISIQIAIMSIVKPCFHITKK